ncbi:lipocalin-like domain-containing protein [Bacteroides sp. OttesenSCG-928-D19]|nr:lipocalin-like domain-containing protein [Bacteroides sp. OttesenSCG-928-N06]MDL2304791.1 lipocalin-like domain-containing protein [Bacteroides sp. OttesenSCG-928-D19]
MKKLATLLFSVGLFFLFVGCADDDAKLTNKWQLRHCVYSDGTLQEVGNVFYNFQKGSFSAICLHTDGEYYTFFGLYTLAEGILSISIKEPQEFEGEVFDTYLGWENGQRSFVVEKLTSSQLVLGYNSNLLVFREY